MAEGRVAEYGKFIFPCMACLSASNVTCSIPPDSPRSLLQNVNSEFHKLCATHGEQELEKLKRLAGL